MTTTSAPTTAPWAPPTLLPILRSTFRSYKIPNLDNPGVTPQWLGRHLWQLTRNPADYGPLPEGARRFLRQSGQGRNQCVTLPTVTHVDAAYLYDMRLAYAAACTNLPHGEPVREQFDAPRAWRDDWRSQPGRYRVTFTIPTDWQHVGIFMVPRADGRTWHYPADAGGAYTTWAASCECLLALDMAWDVRVSERVTFTPRPGAPRPLELWRDRLITIHEEGDEATQKAVRKIILFTIGSFHPRPREEIITSDTFPSDAPPGAKVNRNADGSWTRKAVLPMSEKRALYDHPEWALEVWARTRVKLLRALKRIDGEFRVIGGAFTLPREQVLGFNLDGVITTAPADWPDDGRPGSFRLKDERHYDPPRRAPDPAHPGTLRALFPDEELPPEDGGAEPEGV